MKFPPIAIVLMLFTLILPSLATATDNVTAEQNLTPVSISQNATVSVPAPGLNLTPIGTFENATVYVSGGANATFVGDADRRALRVDMGEASWMEYRDVYLFYRLPPGFSSFSFSYDLGVGEKSNVLLIDFADSLPTKFGVKKGGIPDTAVLGLGTWTNTYSWIRGMNEIGGLKAFPQGTHDIEVVPDGDMLYLKVDGNITVFNYQSLKKYILVHLMVGDQNSYMHGSLWGLKYEGPALDDKKEATKDDLSGLVIPNVALNGSNSARGGQLNVPGGGKEKNTSAVNGTAKPLMGLNIWLALVAAAGFFIAWAIIYVKYLKRS